MITAKQAKQNSDKCFLANLPIEELVDILDRIEKASINGEYGIQLHFSTDIRTKIILKKLGYNVSHGKFFDCDFFTYYVYWDKRYWVKTKESPGF